MKPESASYTKIVEWSDEDRCFVGSAPPLIGPCYHGRNEAAVCKQLCDIVDEWIDMLKSDDKPLPKPTPKGKFSGRFRVRVSPARNSRGAEIPRIGYVGRLNHAGGSAGFRPAQPSQDHQDRRPHQQHRHP